MVDAVVDGVQFLTQSARFLLMRLLLAALILLFAAAPAQAAIEADVPDPCVVAECRVSFTYSRDGVLPVLLVVEVEGQRVSVLCTEEECSLQTPVFDEVGRHTVVLKLADAVVWTRTIQVGEFDILDDEEAYADRFCAGKRQGETCGPGYGRRTPGGNGKVSHKGWPAVTGILWMVTTQDRSARTLIGGPLNDELLGHHGSDRIVGGAGRDILWGDWDPKNNNTVQRDVLIGGDGNDFLYPSHGRSVVRGGRGNDYVWAYYGGGVIDCGPGKDRARVKWIGNKFKVRNCETIGHFCAFGAKPGGGCYKPGEKPKD